MGVSTMEKGVLKLVHPGRHVEIHRRPITAAEVMRKNPRHCVARPDVFKYPWIVVRPESVLLLGRVFFIVPYNTIHHLLKARGLKNLPLNDQDHHYHRADTRQSSHHKSFGGMTPKHQSHYHWLKKPFQCVSWDALRSDEEENFDESCVRRSFDKNGKTYNEFKREKLIDSTVEFGTKECNTQIKGCEQVDVLKSCLRKEGSVPRSHNLRVTFVFPITTISGESPALRQDL